MKLKHFFFYVFCFLAVFTNAQLVPADKEKVQGGELSIQPINHATFVLQYNNKNFYIDPTGGADAFKGLAAPDLIVVTDIHGDHFDPKTIEAINTNKAPIVMPQAVADKMPTADKEKMIVLKNG